MKYFLITILSFSLASCLGQYPRMKLDSRGKYYDANSRIDSVKYYREKYLEFADSMNLTRGRKSARYQDSCERYYKLLYRKP